MTGGRPPSLHRREVTVRLGCPPSTPEQTLPYSHFLFPTSMSRLDTTLGTPEHEDGVRVDSRTETWSGKGDQETGRWWWTTEFRPSRPYQTLSFTRLSTKDREVPENVLSRFPDSDVNYPSECSGKVRSVSSGTGPSLSSHPMSPLVNPLHSLGDLSTYGSSSWPHPFPPDGLDKPTLRPVRADPLNKDLTTRSLTRLEGSGVVRPGQKPVYVKQIKTSVGNGRPSPPRVLSPQGRGYTLDPGQESEGERYPGTTDA